MDNRLILLLTLTLLFGACSDQQNTSDNNQDDPHKLIKKMRPNDYFDDMRSYPDGKFDLKAYESAIAEVKALKKAPSLRTAIGNWQEEGPGNIGGRINTIAADPNNSDIIYVGCAKGGVFKTTNGGSSWEPIFDDQTFLSIGDIEIDPNNSNSIYVGTGDPNISSSHYIGDGLFHSADAGATWTYVGLEDTRIISQVRVHPTNSDIIYVGTMGKPQEANNDRGLYKSTDGGATWNNVLFIADKVGVIDLVVDPTNPNIVFASTWDRFRTDYESVVSGPNGRIHRSTNGGASWDVMSNGLPPGDMSRIGLHMDGSNPNRIVAQFVNTGLNTEGIYETVDAGNSWSQLGAVEASAGFGWYFGKVRINPYNPNQLFVLGVDLMGSNDGGNTWDLAAPEWWSYEVHADKHDMKFIDANTWLLSTDGGLYKTIDGGVNWTDIENIPNTQFYHIKVNPHIVSDYWGGAQDNGTTRGNAANFNNWSRVNGGDGFNVEFSQFASNVVYAETQWGGLVVSQDAGSSFEDANAGFNDAGTDRVNWNAPVEVSVHDANVLYRGSNFVYKSTSGSPVPFWQVVSNDLTDGIANGTRNHEITDISESPADGNIIYVGTTDANAHISMDAGQSWNDITNNLPEFYITDIEAGNQANVVFVTHSGYRSNDFIPHVHASTNNGANWIDISGNLPQIGVNDIEQHPYDDSLLVVATDGGVFYTEDFGGTWNLLGTELPTIVTADIEFDLANSKLIAGTFSRSIWSIDIADLASPPVGIEDLNNNFSMDFTIYPNPVRNSLQLKDIELNSIEGYSIYNMNGQVIQEATALNSSINVEELSAGTYFLVLTNTDGLKGRQQFTKQ